MGTAAYQPGQEIPGTVYRVVAHIATGGMGSVYEVEDTTVEKRYVLKTLHPQLLAREDLARKMKEEAKALAKLHHPNIVDVVTAGVTADEGRVPYYVMERLNGQTLRYVLEKKGALELVYALRVAIDVLDALEHAHEHGIIHRDVKPENIFLHRNASGTTTTKLLDFGIMRLVDHKTTSFKKGNFVGTIRYAAPEQIVGDDVGPSCDVYALGIVLYEMIAGRGPFDDVDEAYAIGMAHVQRAPPPITKFAVNVPAEIERLIMASIAKKPNERPPDAFTFAEELRRLMPGGPISPRVTPLPVSPPMSFEPTVTPAPPRDATSMAGEARTRPPEAEARSVIVPIALAAAFAMTVLGVAILYVVHPWRSAVVAAPSAPVPTVSASVASVAPEPPASAPASAAAAPSASVEPPKKVTPKAPPGRPSSSVKRPPRPEDVGFE